MTREIRTDIPFSARLISASKLIWSRVDGSYADVQITIRPLYGNIVIVRMLSPVRAYETSKVCLRYAHDIGVDIALKLERARMIMLLVPRYSEESLVMWYWYQHLTIKKPITIAILPQEVMRDIRYIHAFDSLTSDKPREHFMRITMYPKPPELTFDGLILLKGMGSVMNSLDNITCGSVLLVVSYDELAHDFLDHPPPRMTFVENNQISYIVYENLLNINIQSPIMTLRASE